MEKKQENKLKERGKHAMTYHRLANVIRDLFVNDEVVSFRKAPVLYQTRQKLFSEKTHNDKDLRSLPKHLQLINAINRERVIAYDKCIVDPDVRKIIDMLMKK